MSSSQDEANELESKLSPHEREAGILIVPCVTQMNGLNPPTLDYYAVRKLVSSLLAKSARQEEEIAVAHKALDEIGAPREDGMGVLSITGRCWALSNRWAEEQEHSIAESAAHQATIQQLETGCCVCHAEGPVVGYPLLREIGHFCHSCWERIKVSVEELPTFHEPPELTREQLEAEIARLRKERDQARSTPQRTYKGHLDPDCEVARGVGWMCTCQTPEEKEAERKERDEIDAEREQVETNRQAQVEQLAAACASLTARNEELEKGEQSQFAGRERGIADAFRDLE